MRSMWLWNAGGEVYIVAEKLARRTMSRGNVGMIRNDPLPSWRIFLGARWSG